ncbi:MAG: tetratricopeptide repeat protein [Polyangia bacterium]|nr:tetratricopeptide repeat protein [Polyangia bacterium]
MRHSRSIFALLLCALAVSCGPPKDEPRRTAPRPIDERPFVPPREVAEPDLTEGKQHIRAGAWDAALKWFEEAIKRNPSDSRPAFYRAVCLYNLKRNQEAVEAYIAASKLKPSFFELWLNLGSVLIVTSQPARAVKALEQALKFQPRSPDAWLNLGVAHEEAKDLQAAARALEKAASYGPTRADIHLAHADVLRKLGQHAAAAKAYQEADERRPGDLYTLINLALAHAKTNQGAEAEKALTKARNLKPDNLRVQMAAGLIYGLLKRYADAEKAYAAALTQKPDQPALLLMMGRAQLDQRKLADAVRTITRAKTLGGAKLPSADFWLAEAHRQAGRCPKAKPLYRSYLQAEPKGTLADQAKAHLENCRK